MNFLVGLFDLCFLSLDELLELQLLFLLGFRANRVVIELLLRSLEPFKLLFEGLYLLERDLWRFDDPLLAQVRGATWLCRPLQDLRSHWYLRRWWWSRAILWLTALSLLLLWRHHRSLAPQLILNKLINFLLSSGLYKPLLILRKALRYAYGGFLGV